MDYASLLVDLFEGIELALIASGAALGRLLPGLRTAEIGLPKGPSPALARPMLVDPALAGLIVKKHAIVVVQFQEAPPDADMANKPRLEIGDRHLQMVCQRLNLGLVDPDKAGRSGATVSTTSALEAQSLNVP